METKFGTGVVFWQVNTCAKFHCPSSTVTLFSGGGWNPPPPVIESQKKPGLNRVNRGLIQTKQVQQNIGTFHEKENRSDENDVRRW